MHLCSKVFPQSPSASKDDYDGGCTFAKMLSISTNSDSLPCWDSIEDGATYAEKHLRFAIENDWLDLGKPLALVHKQQDAQSVHASHMQLFLAGNP